MSRVKNVSTEGLDKAELLAALFNAAKPRGGDPDRVMDVEEARELIANKGSGPVFFTAIDGRTLKLDLDKDNFMPRMYEVANESPGIVKSIISNLRRKNNQNEVETIEKGGAVAKEIERYLRGNALIALEADSTGGTLSAVMLFPAKDNMADKVNSLLSDGLTGRQAALTLENGNQYDALEVSTGQGFDESLEEVSDKVRKVYRGDISKLIDDVTATDKYKIEFMDAIEAFDERVYGQER